jgi:nucleotide-binding universal stress UspA family protein
MTLVVGLAPYGRGQAVLHLAGMLARSAGDDLVVCTVVPARWPLGPAQVESEYRRFLDGMARAALERAWDRLPGDIAADSVVHHARSAPAGLLEVAELGEAAMIVVGTSGHPAIGSVTARLLHGSPVPVALAPHGFRSRPADRVERVTAPFAGGGIERSVQEIERAAGQTRAVVGHGASWEEAIEEVRRLPRPATDRRRRLESWTARALLGRRLRGRGHHLGAPDRVWRAASAEHDAAGPEDSLDQRRARDALDRPRRGRAGLPDGPRE